MRSQAFRRSLREERLTRHGARTREDERHNACLPIWATRRPGAQSGAGELDAPINARSRLLCYWRVRLLSSYSIGVARRMEALETLCGGCPCECGHLSVGTASEASPIETRLTRVKPGHCSGGSCPHSIGNHSRLSLSLFPNRHRHRHCQHHSRGPRRFASTSYRPVRITPANRVQLTADSPQIDAP